MDGQQIKDDFVTRNVNPEPEGTVNDKLLATAAIIDGKLVLKHPPGGPYPVIIPCPGLLLKVNNREQKEATPVRSEDRVEIIPLEEKRQGHWLVTVSADKLEAVLKMKPGVMLCRRLKDLPPAQMLQLETIEEESYHPPFTLEELVREIEKQGIQYGVDWQGCTRLIEEPAEGAWTIARGQPAMPGRDADVRLLFTTRDRVPITLDEAAPNIDYRERFQFTAVEPGMVLARKQPALKGQPGRGVTGDIILPPEPGDIELVAARGTVLSAGGLEVVATRAGRPVARKTKTRVIVEVIPALTHNGDVNLASGNISFSGDVVINGQVEEGMAVMAGGNIYIGDTISRATVRAGGSIEVAGNIFASLLAAGGEMAFRQGLHSILHRIARDLEYLVAAIKQLLKHPSFKERTLQDRVGPLALVLMEKKFPDLAMTVELLQKEVGRLQLIPPEVPAGLIDDLENLVRSPLAIKDMGYLETALEKITAWEQETEASARVSADVTINYAVNANIVATGSIKVMGEGCYHSRLQAGQSVIVKGVFRGGEIHARGDVNIKELGSRTGTPTMVVTGNEGRVTVGHVFENVSIQIGPRRYSFNQEEQGVSLRLDREGEIVKSYF